MELCVRLWLWERERGGRVRIRLFRFRGFAGAVSGGLPYFLSLYNFMACDGPEFVGEEGRWFIYRKKKRRVVCVCV